ncbi:SPOR domain-containing protein [Pseudomonas sp. F1_0610]|uniref:SPOR domain-containing protein n=1 Tax=Pseudomonas sp. F1_0610 TaxID=3114284 RepID=UPI0039C28E3D
MAARKKPAARRGASRAPAATAARKPVHPIIWLVVGALIAVFAMTLMDIGPGKKTSSTPERVQNTNKTTKPADNNQTKPKFEFYTILPESEVIVPPTPEVAPTQTPAEVAKAKELQRQQEAARAQAILEGQTPPPRATQPEAPTTVASAPSANVQYFLQAGSFPTHDQAQTVRAKLLMSGQNVRIEQGVVGNKTWHRVMVGPFSSQEQLKSAQSQLSANGFNNLLPQQRKGS